MKKLTAILLALLMVTLTACSTKPQTEQDPITEVEILGTTVAVTPGSKLENILKTGTLTLVTSPDFAPYEFIMLDKLGQGDEQYAGADIELARYMAQCLGVKLVIEPMVFDGVLASITEGKADIGISGISPKPERKEKVDITDVYYSSDDGAGHGFLINLKNNEKFKTLADLNSPDVTIAVQNGSIQQTAVLEQAPKAKVVIIGQLNEAILELTTGKIDAMATSIESSYNFVTSYPNDLVISGVKLEIPSLGLGAAVTKGNPDLMEALNIIIKDVQDSGKYLVWMDEAIALSETQAAKD